MKTGRAVGMGKRTRCLFLKHTMTTSMIILSEHSPSTLTTQGTFEFKGDPFFSYTASALSRTCRQGWKPGVRSFAHLASILGFSWLKASRILIRVLEDLMVPL